MKLKTFSIRLPALVVSAVFAVALMACTTQPSSSAAALPSSYTLNGEASELRFVTTKNTNLAEVQQFKRLAGDIAPSGAVKLVIDLASIETRVPLRNERMQNMLFDIARFPVAQFEGVVDMNQVKALDAGASIDVDVAGKLTIRGQTQDANAALRVVKLKGDKLLVTTRSPILVFASSFDLASGVEKLREIMGLPNIVGTVPVSFALVFQKQS